MSWVVYEVTEESGAQHVQIVPTDDLKEHELCSECWCKPEPDEELDNLWVHNSLDGREAFESGGRQVS